MRKLAVFFPGIGYTVDKPLMYYSRKIAAELSYEIKLLPYGGFPPKIHGDPDKMRESFKIAMQQTEEMSRGRVKLAAGTLYGALNSLCEKGWIIQLPVEDGSRRKEYRLTEKGKAILVHEIERLRELADNGERKLKEA